MPTVQGVCMGLALAAKATTTAHVTKASLVLLNLGLGHLDLQSSIA